MAAKISTGLREQVLFNSGFIGGFAGLVLRIYSGAPPASADDAATGVMLVEISTNGTGAGLTFSTDGTGVAAKDPNESWEGIAVESGTAGYFRMVDNDPNDDGSSSTSAMRIQGTCGTSGADLNMTDVNVAQNAVVTIDAGSIRVPAQ